MLLEQPWLWTAHSLSLPDQLSISPQYFHLHGRENRLATLAFKHRAQNKP